MPAKMDAKLLLLLGSELLKLFVRSRCVHGIGGTLLCDDVRAILLTTGPEGNTAFTSQGRLDAVCAGARPVRHNVSF